MAATVISVFNQKGGSGKSTVAMNLGGTLAKRGNRVLIADMDPQGTSIRWYSNASDDKPFPASVVNLSQTGQKAHRALKDHIDNHDYIIVDCPPSIDSPIPSSVLLVSDMALIPAVPSPADLWAIVEAKALVERVQQINEGLVMRVVANMVQKNMSITRSALSVLGEDETALLMESRLGLRAAYRECQVIGATVHSIPRATEAVREVEALTDEVIAVLTENAEVEV